MATISQFSKILLAGCAVAALSACGADDVASPGEGTIVIPAPTPTPTPAPTPTPTGVTPATACPNIAGPNALVDLSTISDGNGNTWRNCQFPARFTATTAIPKIAGVVYSLGGRVDVGTDQGAASTGNNVTLTIDPGVVVFGSTGNSYLAVNRGNRISAIGTATSPIVFTSRANVLGTADDQSSGLWGGVVLLGRAKITDCDAPAAAAGTTACERDTEGTSNALYGGANDADNSGTLRFVQIRYSGFVLENAKELQGLTPSGVGSGTVIDHIQVHNSSDDGIEVFGGKFNMKYLVLTGNEDDNLDTDVGYRGAAQYVISAQRSGANIGDTFLETDSNGSTTVGNKSEDVLPRQFLKVANFTHIQRSNTGDDGAAMLVRGGADISLVNGIVISPTQSCLRINSAATARAADVALEDVGPPSYKSVVMECLTATPFKGTSGPSDANVQAIFLAGGNNSFTFSASLTSLFINGAAETAVTATDPKTIDAFFDTTNYVGAVKDAADSWYAGWTCNSVSANFGTTSGSCTAIPTA